MSENKITTISEFLAHSGAKYRIFDMGRKGVKIDAETFYDVELAKTPYPYPFQKAALFGVIFWNPSLPDKHYVWFLTFPLDEQGLILQAARDEFLVMLLDRVGECMLAASDGTVIEGALKDSPYTFKPREDKMAAFNAQATYSLSQPASHYYSAAKSYFLGQTAVNDWQTLGMQGVADVATRLKELDKTAFINTLEVIPSEPFMMLCTFLENNVPSTAVVEKFIAIANASMASDQPDVNIICACLRAISNSAANGLVTQFIGQVLSHEVSRHIEVLAIISGRSWSVLQNELLCQQFVEQLAHNDADYSGFSHILADLMYMPNMRMPVMKALRCPDRSDKLSSFIGTMFGG